MTTDAVPEPAGAPAQAAPIVAMRGIRKSFDGVPVLREVDFEVRRGEVHALVGSNGAGKSTLMKILQGVYTKDAGEILVAGEPVEFGSIYDAKAAGIGMVFQEFSLVPSLTVAQNIYLTAEARGRFGLISDRESRRRARAVFAELGIPVEVEATVADLATAYRQLTEIAKALAQDAQVLIMDEPTASLAKHEVASLFELIGRLRDRGISIIYISHRLEEIYRIADRITVLRDGRRLLTSPPSAVTPAQVVEGIVGRELDGSFAYRDRTAAHPDDTAADDTAPGTTAGGTTAGGTTAGGAGAATGEVLLAAADLHAGTRVNGVSFDLHAGEIVGIAGLMGSGRTELARCLFGVDRLDSGELRVRGRRVTIGSPRAAQRAGLALIPEDRRDQGLVLDHSVTDNLVLPLLGRLRRGPLLDLRAARRLAKTFIEGFDIKVADPAQPVRRLSGGNQQKVVIAKWLGTEPDVLIMDEPTAGVDVGTKAEIIAIIRRLADSGHGVIVISSEYPELLAVSDRVLVLRDGMVAGELARADIAGEESLQLAVQGV